MSHVISHVTKPGETPYCPIHDVAMVRAPAHRYWLCPDGDVAKSDLTLFRTLPLSWYHRVFPFFDYWAAIVREAFFPPWRWTR